MEAAGLHRSFGGDPAPRRRADLFIHHLGPSEDAAEQAVLSEAPVHAKLPAKDLKRAQRFYEEVLGLKRIGKGPTGVFYGSADTKVYVFESAAPGTNQATAAGWEVEDIEAEVADLRRRGVQFEEYDLGEIKTVNGIADLEGERAAWFKDTEGNILNIAQVVAD